MKIDDGYAVIHFAAKLETYLPSQKVNVEAWLNRIIHIATMVVPMICAGFSCNYYSTVLLVLYYCTPSALVLSRFRALTHLPWKSAQRYLSKRQNPRIRRIDVIFVNHIQYNKERCYGILTGRQSWVSRLQSRSYRCNVVLFATLKISITIIHRNEMCKSVMVSYGLKKYRCCWWGIPWAATHWAYCIGSITL